MSENNLSIDEILKEAEKALLHIEEKSKKSISELNDDTSSKNEDDVKTYTPSKNDDVKVFSKNVDSQKEDDVKIFSKSTNTKFQDDVKVFKPDLNNEKTSSFKLSYEEKDLNEKTSVINSEKIKKQNLDNEKTTLINSNKLNNKNAFTEKTTTFNNKFNSVSEKTIPVNLKNENKSTVHFDNQNEKTTKFSLNRQENSELDRQNTRVIERSALIKGKSKFEKTFDLQEIPTIISVDKLDKTKMINLDDDKTTNNSSSSYYNEKDQIKLDGFDDKISEVPTIDEEVAEKLLKKRREDKVNKFRLFAKEEFKSEKKNGLKDIVGDDIKTDEDTSKTLKKFSKKRTSYKIAIAFTIIFSIPLLILTLIHNTSYMPSVLRSDETFYLVNLVLYGLVLITNIKDICHGFNLKHGFNFDFPIMVSSILVLLHTILLFVNPKLALNGGEVLVFASTFSLLLSTIGKRAMMTRIIENFKFLTSSKETYTVEDIVNDVDAVIISRNLLTGEPLLKYSVKTDKPTSFLEISCAREPADRISEYLGPIMIAVNLILFAVVAVFSLNITFAFNVLVAGILISCPVITMYATNSTLRAVSKKIAKKGALVCGFEGAQVTHNSNAIVMETSDLFYEDSCALHGVKTFNNAKLDDAILKTAAVIMKTNSPLKSAFNKVIADDKSVLPYVDSVVYENKLGACAVIYQQVVLVGNRDLLIKHGVNVPKESYEKQYTQKGRHALYVAQEGKILAMFIVSYSADDKIKKNFKKLEKTGITVLLENTDPFLNEKTLNKLFNLPDGFVRFMNNSNARTFDKYANEIVEKSPAYTVHNGSVIGLFTAIRASEHLVSVEEILNILVTFASSIGFAIIALLTFINGTVVFNALNIVIFEVVWSIFILLVTKIKRIGL